ncbi:MAG: hypothetical protein P9X24_04755 [Candidatus Hatepunaea meridiana]|nr:hypothetical protein [Candidatus Hatepunaea meridiana]
MPYSRVSSRDHSAGGWGVLLPPVAVSLAYCFWVWVHTLSKHASTPPCRDL